MDEFIDPGVFKEREISFSPLHPDRRQAHTALLLLDGVEGVRHVRLLSDTALSVSYDLRRLSLQVIEGLLEELGFHLDGSLLCQLKRALYYYTEETECVNRGCGIPQPGATREVFVSRYQRLPHGCRDPRPDYWRTYL